MPKSTILVRPATTHADAQHLIGLVIKLAEFEELDGPDSDAKVRFFHDGFERNPPRFSSLLAYRGDSDMPCGGAVYFDIYSTFLCKPTLYLEDLIVIPEDRGSGVGTAILSYLIKMAKSDGYGRVEWACLDWNTKGHDFYAKIGARCIKEWLHYRMDEVAIEKFAETH